MTTLYYKILFYSDWHCGSGLAAGADVDALVIKDKNNLPFVPGKTMKGLLREAVEDILFFKNETDTIGLEQVFGNTTKGCCYFSNAVLHETLQVRIRQQKADRFLYRAHASTAIDECGLAKEHSLRRVQTVVPCELHGTIHHIPNALVPCLRDGLRMIKRMGVNRHRGLGRCDIQVEPVTKEVDK